MKRKEGREDGHTDGRTDGRKEGRQAGRKGGKHIRRFGRPLGYINPLRGVKASYEIAHTVNSADKGGAQTPSLHVSPRSVLLELIIIAYPRVRHTRVDDPRVRNISPLRFFTTITSKRPDARSRTWAVEIIESGEVDEGQRAIVSTRRGDKISRLFFEPGACSLVVELREVIPKK